MASMEEQIAADNEAVEEYRARFGDDAAAQLWADLYKLRRTPPAGASSFGTFPRSIVILIALWVGLLETADKLPRLLLAYPGYEATLAEFQAKMLQPELTRAQLTRAKNEAKASTWQAYTAAAQGLDMNAKFINDASGISPDTLLRSGYASGVGRRDVRFRRRRA